MTTKDELSNANINTQFVLTAEIIRSQNSIFYAVADVLRCLNPIFDKAKHEKENSIFTYEDFSTLKTKIKILSDVQCWNSISPSTEEYIALIKRNEELLKMLNSK